MPKERLAIIVPTKDRIPELKRLFMSMEKQDIMPVQVIVVDGGSESAEAAVSYLGNRCKVNYIKKIPASLTAQRNAGIDVLGKDCTLVAFLDDDILLEKDCFANMLSFWNTAGDEVGGVSLNNMSDQYRTPSIAQRIFNVNADVPGEILVSGFQSKLCSLTENTRVKWLLGCAMVFRKKVLDEFRFDEWYSGYARYEDVDFSYRVGKKYKLYVVADARVQHLNRAEDTGYSYSLGRMEVLNRLYFVRKNPELSVPLCYWALFGYFLNNFLKGLLTLDRRYMLRSLGNIAGFIRV